jgi:hypothetical protein
MKKYFCQRRDDAGNVCGLECDYLNAVLEYAVIKGEELTRKPVATKRVLLVNCPVHGRVTYEHMGHHVTARFNKSERRFHGPKK